MDKRKELALIRAEIVKRLPTMTLDDLMVFYRSAIRMGDGDLVKRVLDEALKRGRLGELRAKLIKARLT